MPGREHDRGGAAPGALACARPAQLLAEARRVLEPGGRLGVLDGDYATITLAAAEDDPLQCCVTAFREAYITDPWVMRRMPALMAGGGLVATDMRSHGFVQVDHPDHMLSIADRGADALAASGRIGTELAAALKGEARRRVEAKVFFGHVAYLSMVATLPYEKSGA